MSTAKALDPADLNVAAKVTEFLKIRGKGYKFTVNSLVLDYNTDPAFADTLDVNTAGAAVSKRYKAFPHALSRKLVNERTGEREYVLLDPDVLHSTAKRSPRPHKKNMQPRAAPRLPDTPDENAPLATGASEAIADPLQEALDALVNAAKHHAIVYAGAVERGLSDYTDEELMAEVQRRLNRKKGDTI